MLQLRHLMQHLLGALITFCILQGLSNSFITNVALSVLALLVTDYFISVFWSLFPGPMIENLQDKAILITGCDSGFGNELARTLDAKGATVFAGCLFSEGSGAKKLQKDCSKQLQILQLDVTQDEQIKTAVKEVKNNISGKKLWAVVNNAGILVGGEAVYMCMETTKKLIDVNILGAIRITQAFLPSLKQSKGRIINVASYAGIVSIPYMSSYNMTKAAIISFSNTLRMELLRWSVSVHTIEPYAYRTNLTNPETVCENIMKEWAPASEEIKEAYGKDCSFENFMKLHKTFLSFHKSESKIHQVVDCLVHATIGQRPNFQYITGMDTTAVCWFAKFLPTYVCDTVYFLITHFICNK